MLLNFELYTCRWWKGEIWGNFTEEWNIRENNFFGTLSTSNPLLELYTYIGSLCKSHRFLQHLITKLNTKVRTNCCLLRLLRHGANLTNTFYNQRQWKIKYQRSSLVAHQLLAVGDQVSNPSGKKIPLFELWSHDCCLPYH